MMVGVWGIVVCGLGVWGQGGGAFGGGGIGVGLGGLVWWHNGVVFVWDTGEPAHSSAEAVRLWERESAGEDLFRLGRGFRGV